MVTNGFQANKIWITFLMLEKEEKVRSASISKAVTF